MTSTSPGLKVSGVWDSAGNSLGDALHPPMIGNALLAYPYSRILGIEEAVSGKEQFSPDLLVLADPDGQITHDVLIHAVATVERNGTLLVFGWTDAAIQRAINTVLRMAGGGNA